MQGTGPEARRGQGYDSERVHESCYERGIISIIPARRGVRRGFYRRKMKPYNKLRVYHRRETAECLFSVMKRRCGGSVRSRKARSIRSELDFRAIAHNLKVGLRRLFHRGPKIVHFLDVLLSTPIGTAPAENVNDSGEHKRIGLVTNAAGG